MFYTIYDILSGWQCDDNSQSFEIQIKMNKYHRKHNIELKITTPIKY